MAVHLCEHIWQKFIFENTKQRLIDSSLVTFTEIVLFLVLVMLE